MVEKWTRIAFSDTLSGSGAGGGSQGGAIIEIDNIPAKEHLLIIGHGVGTGNHRLGLKFNDDTGNTDTNYSYAYQEGGSYNASATTNKIILTGHTSNDTDETTTGWCNVHNTKLYEKTCRSIHTSSNEGGAGTAPIMEWNFGKWTNATEQITKIKMFNIEDGTLTAGTSLTVYGADDQGTSPLYPNLSNGTLFEESDTGKILMFDGTDTWNEVT